MVDIVIVTYNALSKLKACLESVRRHTPVSSYRLHIINNGSTDGTLTYLKGLRQKSANIFHLPKNLGFSGGANYALDKLRLPYSLFLDDDARVSKGWLSGMLRTLKKSKKIGMVGCKLVYPDGKIFFCEARITPLRAQFIKDEDRGQADYTKEVDLIAGACFLVPRRILKEIGPFDETFFPSQFEDWDYCMRIRRAGYKIIYDGSVTVVHDNLFRADGNYQRNEKLFEKKWAAILKKKGPFADSHIADQLMSQACRALEAGDNMKALALCDRLRVLHPELVELWIPALAHVRLRNYQKAIPFLQELAARNAESDFAKNYLTLCLRQGGTKKMADVLTDQMLARVSGHIQKRRENREKRALEPRRQ